MPVPPTHPGLSQASAIADAEAHWRRGQALEAAGHDDAALASYDEAVRIRPDFVPAHCHRGRTLGKLGRTGEALKSFDRAIALGPNFAEAHLNRGVALLRLQRPAEALSSFDRAIALRPDDAEAHVNRGTALARLGRDNDALPSFDRAIGLDPGSVPAHINRAASLRRLRRYREALVSYDRALSLAPGDANLRATRLFEKMLICDWSDLDADLAALTTEIEHKATAISPFRIVVLTGAPALHRRVAELWVQNRFPDHPTQAAFPRQRHGDKIRIGYFSADYSNHATMQLMGGVFEQHDRASFETIAFSFGPPISDAGRLRAVASFDKFIDVREHTDQQVAGLARHLEIHIAVDLKGFTRDGRPGIFAAHAAPVQVSYLGYPGTMGAPYVDYLIADSVVVPRGHEQNFAEKIVRLPHSYQANDRSREISATGVNRQRAGLPDGAFVFCCFNRAYKITPAVFDDWMQLLRDVEGSVLWLLGSTDATIDNLRHAAVRRAIDPQRLVFASPLPVAEHLARHRLADVFLDTLPCNAHTTASDALWAGLPVLTQAGETFAGRVAASLLTAIGLPELVTRTRAEYLDLARQLAHDRERLAGLRNRLAANRLSSPLFDTQAFTRQLEAAYTAIAARHHAGLPPVHIDLAT